MKSLLCLVCLLVAVLFFSSVAKASGPPEIVFNEVAWRGSSVLVVDESTEPSSSVLKILTADEFIELKNMTAEPVVLDGWTIYDEVKLGEMLKIPSATIAPEGYFLIANNKKGHIFSAGASFLNIEPAFVDSSVSLNNDFFKISLRNKDGKIIDVAGDKKKPYHGGLDKEVTSSMQRIDYTQYGDFEAAWEPTKERKNIISLDYATPENTPFNNTVLTKPVIVPVGQQFIKFTELAVKPKEDYNTDGKISYLDEWIEIANTSTKTVNLSGIKIFDKSTKSYVIEDVSIAPLSCLVIDRKTSVISLNDSGEILSMTDLSGKIIDYVEVPRVPTKALSYAMWANKWYFTTEATVGIENSIKQIKQTKNPSGENIENSEGLLIKINAVVTSIERDRSTVIYDKELIDLMSGYENLSAGDKIAIVGYSHSGSNHIVDASSVNRIKEKIKSAKPVKTKISTKRKAKIISSVVSSSGINFDSYNFEKIKPFFSSTGFNFGRILLYSYSIFLFAFIILSNEIFSSLKL